MTKHKPVPGFDPKEHVMLYDDDNSGPDELFEREIRVGVGENQYWSTVSEWKGTLFEMLEPGGPLHPHDESDKSAGYWLLSGMTIAQKDPKLEKYRRHHRGWAERDNIKMDEVVLMMFDFDQGYPIDEVIKPFVEQGVACIVYTTHSHGKTYSDDATPNNIDAHMKKTGIEDIEKAIRDFYLTVKKYAPRIVNSMTVPQVWTTGDDGRQHYPVTHDPIPKYRVITFLKEPFKFQREAEQISIQVTNSEWKKTYKRMAAVFGGSTVDSSCANSARLMFAPQFKPGTVLGDVFDGDHGIGFVGGGFLDPEAVMKADFVGNVEAQMPGSVSYKEDDKGQVSQFDTPNLAEFLRAHPYDFQLVDMLRDRMPNIIVRDMEQDKVEIRCPDDDLHSDPDRTESSAAFATQSGSDGDGWWIGCGTDGCKGRYHASHFDGFDKWKYLDRVIQHYDIVKDAWDLEEWCDEQTRGPRIGLPHAFSRQDGQIWVEVKTQKKTCTVSVCQDFEVLARARSPEGNEWGRIIQFRTEDGQKKHFFVPDRDLAGDGKALRERLRSEGFWIGTAAKARESLLRLFNELKTDKKATRCTKPGWYDSGDAKVFVAPTGKVSGDVAVDDFFMLDGERQVGFEPHGDEAQWRAGVTRCLRPKTPHWALGICIGAAGTVVDLLEESSFGINFYGSSSTGKTTAQKVGAGMWGSPEPDQGLLYTCRSTDNAMEFLLERGNGTSIHLDEAKTGKSRELADLAFFIAGGVGKKRMRADASERESKNWRTVATISSEKPMSSIVQDANTAEVSGLHVRMPAIDVSGLTPLPANEAADIRQVLLRNYGFGGPLFVQALIDLGYHKDATGLRERIDQRQTELLETTNLPTVERAARQFAILWVCGDIMREAGIIDMETDKFGEAVQWAWQTWLNGDDARKLAPISDSVDTLIEFFQNNPRRVVRCGSEVHAYQEILAYYDETTVYLPVSSLRKIPGLQSSDKAILKALDERGLLIRQGKNRRHDWIPLVGEGRPHHRLAIKLYDPSIPVSDQADFFQDLMRQENPG